MLLENRITFMFKMSVVVAQTSQCRNKLIFLKALANKIYASPIFSSAYEL